jgi:hypothetical protein
MCLCTASRSPLPCGEERSRAPELRVRNNCEVVLMTRKALHSAVLEVGLYFQKGWSVDHIAWFTHRLQRRRQRASDEAARARIAARAIHAQGLTVPYQIEPHPDPSIGYAVSTSTAEARIANERLFDRLRARLSKRLSGSESRHRLGLPCAACGQPATGWNYVAHDEDGQRVIEGYATCAAHRLEESQETLAGTRTG